MTGKTLAELRKLDRTQFNKINKDELINAILSANETNQSDVNASIQVLVNELRDLKEALHSSLQANANEVKVLKETIKNNEERFNSRLSELETRISKQDEIIKNQQGFFEKLDSKERETKLVVLGVPDEQESLDGATDDDTKLRKVWETVGETSPIQSHQRLGKPQTGRSRPILVHVATREHRDSAVGKARKLNDDAREPFKKIFVKRDTHPAVRREWGRLRSVLRNEQTRAENVGVRVYLDTRERKVYMDGIVIDSWSLQNF